MKLLLSKIYRILIRDKQIPSTCYAYQSRLQSQMEICDCDTICKFPPNENNSRPILKYVEPISYNHSPFYYIKNRINLNFTKII